jgi:hypothetical protein
VFNSPLNFDNFFIAKNQHSYIVNNIEFNNIDWNAVSSTEARKESEGVHCNLSQLNIGRIAANAVDENRVVAA